GFPFFGRSARRAVLRIPAAAVVLLPEIAARDRRNGEIRGIVDDRLHDEPLRAVGLAEHVEVLRQNGAGAIGDAVLAEVPFREIRRRDLQRTVRGRSTETAAVR